MLTVTGSVFVWGNNTHGQLLDGSTTLREVPVRAAMPDDVVAIEAASNVAYARRSDGSVIAWGHNLEGKLGDGTEDDRLEPIVVDGLADVTALAAAGDWACAVRRDGTVWAWGNNSVGQMGNGTTDTARSPVQVVGLDQIVSVAAGLGTGFALRRDGTVWAWGYHAHGECGGFPEGDVCLSPVEVTSQVGEGEVVASDGLVAYRSLGDIVAITAGAFAGFALTRVGTVWSWGANELGQLGNGTTSSGVEDLFGSLTRHDSPQKVVDLNDVISVVSKCNTAYALRTDGTVWSWGENRHGALGIERSLAELLEGNEPAHAAILHLGKTALSNKPQRVSDLTDIVSISANGDSAYAVRSDGTVWAWGENEYGELGDGTRIDRARPVKVPGLEGITSITAGITCAYATTGKRVGTEPDLTPGPKAWQLPGGRTAFMHWSSVGDVNEILELLRQGGDVNAVDHDGDSVLYYAVTNRNLHIAEMLLDHGADPDLAGANGTPVRFASDKGWVDILDLLLRRGADASGADATGITAAMLAAGGAKNDVLLLLDRHGADFGEVDADGDTVLFYAVSRGHVGTAELLISAGAAADPRPNASGHTPMTFAAIMAVSPQQRPEGTTADDYNAIVRLLLRAGADPTRMFGLGLGLARRVMNGLDFILDEYEIGVEIDDEWIVIRLAAGQTPRVIEHSGGRAVGAGAGCLSQDALGQVARVEVLGSTQTQFAVKPSVKVFWNGRQVGVVEHAGRFAFDIHSDGEVRFKSHLRSRRVQVSANGTTRIELSWDTAWGRLLAKVT